ncbi:MAG TPA: TetR/AcrR family transcriptional regulator [Ilumatobacteraceae bacterium]|nr:TetR/AcrR family transcriptional regulator [Ilumatobacteraceae bacterium]
MPPRLVSESDLIDRLGLLFRTTGYDGSSLADIAAATGLQKSSLYHRFPGGKQEMATEVAGATGAHFAQEVLAPLSGTGTAHDRLTNVAERLRQFYEGGRQSCLLDTLSIGDPGTEATTGLGLAAEGWIAAFADVARSEGAARAEARRRAEDAVAAIEGALVLARVTGNLRPFTRSLERLPSLLLEPSPR